MQNSAKTYAETKGKRPFDWSTALSARCDDMEMANVDRMVLLAESWVTCACGSLCDVIPRTADGLPDDEQLRAHGATFYVHVSDMSKQMRYMTDMGYRATAAEKANAAREKAVDTLGQIEVRSAALISDI
jgi:hypothetical protein